MTRPASKLSPEEVFNAAADLVLADQPVDAFLQAHPEHAAELTSLLETAGFVLRGRGVPPRAPAVAAASRQRFMAAARSLAAARQAPGPLERLGAWWAALLAGFSGGRRPAYALATLLVIVLLLGVSTTGIVTAAGAALPGDRLYSVKLVTEQVQLMLARDAAARSALEQMIGDRRVHEAQAIMTLRRPVAQLHIFGLIEAFSATEWQIAGLKIVITADTVIVGQPAVGALAFAELTAPGDGSLIALVLRISPADGPAGAARPAATETPTPLPTPTDPPTPTDTPTPTISVEPAVVASAMPEPSATPAPTTTPTRTATPTRTRTPTPTIGPSPTLQRVLQPGRKFGTLVSKNGNRWVIREADAAWEVLIDGASRLENDPQVGDWVEAELAVRYDTYVVVRLIAAGKPEATAEPMDFLGLIQKLEGEWWTVNGILFKVTGDTDVEGQPDIDRHAEVHAGRRANGEIWAYRVVVRDAPYNDLPGMIELVSQNYMVLHGATVETIYFDHRTRFSGDPPMVNRWADVRALRLPDGRLLARTVMVYPPTPVPTITATRTPRPTRAFSPTPTATLPPPTATRTPTATVSGR